MMGATDLFCGTFFSVLQRKIENWNANERFLNSSVVVVAHKLFNSSPLYGVD